MIPENLPKSVILHKSKDKNFSKIASLLLKWNVIVHETNFLSGIKDKDILYDIPIALAIANSEDTRGIDFLRSMLRANLLTQRMMLSASVDFEMFEVAINKAHINYFSKLPIKNTSFAIYLQKANKRFQQLTEPLIKYSTLKKVTEGILVDKERYRQEAKIDSLTMLMNRRSFDSIIKRIWNRFKDKGTVFSLAIFDIDHFKKVNDTFGHSIGDEVLKKISEIILNKLRLGMDFAFRYGGE
ncbi:MAG: GGDEF domain-containing protein, partial [Desulfobacterales bacterium]